MNDKLKLSVEYAGKTDIGPVRSENQDSIGKFPEGVMDLYAGKGQLFIVADGMGGHAGGKIASRMAVDTVSKIYFSREIPSIEEAVKLAIEQANKRIFDESSYSDYNLAGMGTTCSVLVLKADKAVIGHVGDSRIYKIEQNKIEQLTEDHTQVNEMLKEGILSRKEAMNYPLKTVLARALGTDRHVKVDIINDIFLNEGQSFVICSDGLGKVEPEEILKIVSGNSAGAACVKLINAAFEKGGTDNVTVQVIKISAEKAPSEVSPQIENKKTKSKVLFFLIIIFALIIAGILTMNIFPFFNPLKNSSKAENSVINKSSPGGEIKIPKEKKEIKQGRKPAQKNPLIAEADELFNKGEIKKAEDIYKFVLKNEPMHFSAMDGLSKIALHYFQEAEELRSKNKLEEALKYYLKMEELQPGNSKIIDLIKLCEYHIRIKKH